MTEQERFQRAFAPLHAPSDTLTEVMKMTEQTHRKSGRRTAVIALAAALLLATGSAAYAADLGSIQRRGAALAPRRSDRRSHDSRAGALYAGVHR